MSADILEELQSFKAKMTSIDERLTIMDSGVISNLQRMDNKIDRVLMNGGSLENVKMESVEDNDNLAQSHGDQEGGEDEINSDGKAMGEPGTIKIPEQVFNATSSITQNGGASNATLLKSSRKRNHPQGDI